MSDTFLEYSKAFDLIIHDVLLNKMVPAHLVQWVAAFLLDREQRVKHRRRCVQAMVSEWRLSPGHFIRAQHFLSISMICKRLVLFISMLTTTLYLKYVANT